MAITFTTFVEQFGTELGRQLYSGECSAEDIVRWASEHMFESYRNGITARQQGTTVRRQGDRRWCDLLDKPAK